MAFLWRYLRRSAIGEIFDTHDNSQVRQDLRDNLPPLSGRMAIYAVHENPNGTVPPDIRDIVRKNASTFKGQIQVVRTGKTRHSMVLYIMWAAALYTTIVPIYLAIYFGARPALQREIVQKCRIFPELIAFALIGNMSARVLWQYLYITVLPQVPSVIMYFALRVNSEWRHLYGTWPYTGGVIGAIAVLLFITYGAPFVRRRVAKRSIRARAPIIGEARDRLTTELQDLQRDLAAFNAWKKSFHPTRAVRSTQKICSESADAIVAAFRDRLRRPATPQRSTKGIIEGLRDWWKRRATRRRLTKSERYGKLIIWSLMFVIVGLNSGANYRDPMALPIVLVIGLAMAAEMGAKAIPVRYSLAEVLDMFALIGAPQFVQLAFGSFPLLATYGQFLNSDRNMIWSTTVQVILQWAIGHKIGPAFLLFCTWCGLIKVDDEPDSQPQGQELQEGVPAAPSA